MRTSFQLKVGEVSLSFEALLPPQLVIVVVLQFMM